MVFFNIEMDNRTYSHAAAAAAPFAMVMAKKQMPQFMKRVPGQLRNDAGLHLLCTGTVALLAGVGSFFMKSNDLADAAINSSIVNAALGAGLFIAEKQRFDIPDLFYMAGGAGVAAVATVLMGAMMEYEMYEDEITVLA